MIQFPEYPFTPQEQCDMTDKKHDKHEHKQCDEPVTTSDFDPPLPGDGDDGDESGGGGTTNPKDPGGK